MPWQKTRLKVHADGKSMQCAAIGAYSRFQGQQHFVVWFLDDIHPFNVDVLKFGPLGLRVKKTSGSPSFFLSLLPRRKLLHLAASLACSTIHETGARHTAERGAPFARRTNRLPTSRGPESIDNPRTTKREGFGTENSTNGTDSRSDSTQPANARDERTAVLQ